MKGIQGNGTSMIEDYPMKQHPFLKDTENTPFLYNTFMKTPRKILQIDPITNKILKIYKSISDAAKDIKRDRSGIQYCLKGEQKTAGGFKWEYLK